MTEWNAAQAYEIIFNEIIPEAIEHFRQKTVDYTGGPAFLLLGKRGQFGDINRKYWKLYKSMWCGEPLEGEGEEEILEDFIGHCLLSIFCIRYGSLDQPLDPAVMAARMEMAQSIPSNRFQRVVTEGMGLKTPLENMSCGVGVCPKEGKSWTPDQKHWVCDEHYNLWEEFACK